MSGLATHFFIPNRDMANKEKEQLLHSLGLDMGRGKVST
jgi:hypothetical protein